MADSSTLGAYHPLVRKQRDRGGFQPGGLGTCLAMPRGRMAAELQLIGTSEAIENVRTLAAQVAAVDAGILLVGEAGTGREHVARLIHATGARVEGPFVCVTCSVLGADRSGDELLETVEEAGLLAQGTTGTVFFDEIDRLPLAAQARLARTVAQARDAAPAPRVMASSRTRLDLEVARRRFRGDLYYQVAVVAIALPPLRERRGDIPALAAHFLDRAGAKVQKRFAGIEGDAIECLAAHPWRGNLDELAAAIERAAIVERGPALTRASLPPQVAASVAA